MFRNIKKNNINFCLTHPWIVIFISLFLSLSLFSSLYLGYLKQDDNMINLLPDDIGSRKTFEEIQNNFELTEYMYVAIGNKQQKLFDSNNLLYTENTLEAINKLTKELDNIMFEGENIVERVVSIITIYDMDKN